MFIVSLFVPFYDSSFNDVSLWSGETSSRVPFLIGGIAMILIYLINVRTEITYLFSGYGFFYCIDMLVTSSKSLYYDVDVFGAGFWLLFISSIILILLTFVMNFKVFNVKIGSRQAVEAVTRIPKAVPMARIEQSDEEIVGYDAATGRPIVGYNPMTGEPIFKAESKKPNIVGYDPMNGRPIVGYDPDNGNPIYM